MTFMFDGISHELELWLLPAYRRSRRTLRHMRSVRRLASSMTTTFARIILAKSSDDIEDAHPDRGCRCDHSRSIVLQKPLDLVAFA